MKTNVDMIRKMGDFEIIQRSKDSMFNAGLLLKQWNKQAKTRRRIDEFLNSPNTKKFKDEILKNESKEVKNRHIENQVVMIKKGRKTKNGQTPNEVWMHPYLFIDFAMYLNPKFKYDVIKFVHDQLIEFRHNAGDNYIGLMSAVQRFNRINYPKLAKALNYIIFGRHEKGIRQNASISQLKELTELQIKLAFVIDMGYIKSFDELINEMRRLYKSRNLELL